ncbi:protein of unknown function [Chryseobacterium sp. JV274]|nr:protein of unknown function [Chryseobacterium sp. JV274]
MLKDQFSQNRVERSNCIRRSKNDFGAPLNTNWVNGTTKEYYCSINLN